MLIKYRITDAWDGVVRLVDHPVKLLTAVEDDCKGFAFLSICFFNGAKVSSARTHQNIKMPIKNLDMQ